MIDRRTSVRRALRQRQRGFIINPFRFGGGGGGSDPDFASVSSLLHLDGTDGSTTFTDVKGKIWTGAGNAQIDTAQSKFGGASLLLDGTGDYINTPNHASLNFGTGDATVELFARTAVTTGTSILICKHQSATGSWIVFRNGTSLLLYVSSTGSGWDIANGISIGTIAASTWYHVAWVRDGTTFRTFLDGVPGSTATSSSSIYAGTQPLTLGGNPGAGDYFNGHLDEVRVTTGVARYTSAFSPPIAAFPNS